MLNDNSTNALACDALQQIKFHRTHISMAHQNKKNGPGLRFPALLKNVVFFGSVSNFARSFTGLNANGNKFSKLKATSMRLTPSQKHINLSVFNSICLEFPPKRSFFYRFLLFRATEINGMVKQKCWKWKKHSLGDCCWQLYIDWNFPPESNQKQ